MISLASVSASITVASASQVFGLTLTGFDLDLGLKQCWPR